MAPTWLDYLQALGVIAGIGLVLYELRSQRGANFVSAWSTLITKLQDDNLRAGRWLLRSLWLRKVPPERPSAWTPPKGWAGPPDLVKCAKDAYDNFDVAGITVLHSKIPGLANIFVAEYCDSIIACWEQGVSFFSQRVLELQPPGGELSRAAVREELYPSFSVLYVMAKHRQEKRPQSYPFYTLRDRIALYRPWSHWESQARQLREGLISQTIAQPNIGLPLTADAP